jgi:hypothetical protein
MPLRSSHILCKVDDIHSLVSDYRELGFTVDWGSAPERAHNALVWFDEGPFLEFFELPARFALLRWPFGVVNGAPAGQRLAKWARAAEGWCDLALECDGTELAGTRSELVAAGARVSKVMNGKRVRPDGLPVRYQYLAPAPSVLPFVVSAYDPPQRPERVTHPNGARAVARIRYGVADRDRADLAALVGDDRWLCREPADRTAVLGVELAGLETVLDPAKLHGAVLGPETEGAASC